MIKPRLLALDVGEKRIGVAISDPLGMTAQAHPYISAGKDALDKIKQLVDNYQIAKVYVGLPLNLKGDDTLQTEKVRQFKAALEEKIGMTVQYIDERFSSKAAERHLLEMDMSRKKRKEHVDSQAAAFMLGSVL